MEQKRKSSLAQNAGGDPKKEDDQTVEITRFKRRISFREKKSIRVFSAEEETKAWNNSYEISDRVDPSNNTNEHLTNSSENRTHSITGLCTTSEFIDKTYHGDLYIENSLGITMSEFEMLQKKQNSIDSVKRLNLNSMGKPNDENLPDKTIVTTKKIESNVPQLQSEQQPYRNPAASNFIYLNENSNKENIEPEIVEIFNAKTNKADEDFDASDGPYHNHMKHQSTPQRHATTISNQNQCPNEIGIGRAYEVSQNISGVCSIDSPISFIGRYSSDFSPLIPQNMLPPCSKKISFQQLNEDIANGHLKLFPPTPNRKGLFACKKSEIIVEDAADDAHVEKSRRIEKNQTVYTHKDIETTIVNNLHDAKARSSIKDPTTYFDIGIESTCMNNLKASETKSLRTAFFDDCIEIEGDKVNEKEFVASKDELKSKFEKSKKEASLMRSDDDLTHNEPNHKKPCSNRPTIYFENDVIETENDGNQELDETMVQEDVTPYTKVNPQNIYQSKPKLQFLQTTTTTQEQIELKGNAKMEEEDSSKSKRYTHHFDNSGIMDLTNNLIEVNKNLKAARTNISKVNSAFEQSLLEKSDSIIPETEAMELSHEISMPQNDIENILNKNRHTKYFEQNDQMIEITNVIKNANIPETSFSSKTIDESYIGKTKLLNQFKEKRTECFINETQHMDFTLESYKLPNEKVPMNRQTNYFDQIEENTTMSDKKELYNSNALQYMPPNMAKENCKKNSHCIIPDTEIIDLTSESPETKKNEEIPTQRRTNYFDQNEPINITNIIHNETECIIPETQAMDVSFVPPKCTQEIVDLPKNSRTHYFNNNEEINITHCSNENQKLFDAKKASAIQIEEPLSSTNRIEQNKQLKKAPEYRKTTYFGCDVSLDLTNKVNDMNESKYNTPVTETMEFTNRHNSNRNEQIKVTKMNHKDIECVIPETQDMNVSIKSSNLNNKIDLPKNRQTNYFNQTAEIDIAQDTRGTQNFFNATKSNAIQIEEPLSSTNRIEKNKQLKKAPEYRKTTYFGCDVSLDLTNKVNDMNESKYITPVTETMEFTNRHNSNRNEQIKVTKMNHKDIECVIPETQDMNVSIKSSNLNNKIDLPKNRQTNYFNQTAEIDIAQDTRGTQNFFNATKSNAIQIEEPLSSTNRIEQNKQLKKAPEYRKTTYFGCDMSLDVTNKVNDMNETKYITPVTETMEFTNRHNSNRNEQIKVTKMNHKDIECVIPETQDMNVSIKSSNLNNKIDLPKNRQTNYFNQTAEIDIAHDTRGTQNFFNATKSNAIQIEEPLSSTNRIEQNKQLKKGPEYRKTTYFGCDVSLDLTNKVNDMNESKYITPVTETMEFTNRHNSNRNEQIKATKMNHKDIECVIPETQDMNVSIKSSNLNNKIDLPKNRHTNYFNQTAEIDIAHDTRENQKLFNATKSNPIQIEEPLSSTNRIEKNKQLKKAPEYRKTTYFGCDVSLDLTNKVNDMNETKYITPVTETMEFTNRHNSNRNEQIKVTKMNHKDIECVIPETQDMNVSIKSSNLNNKIDLPKNRQTNYFNQTAEIDIAQDARGTQNFFNATKSNEIQIEEPLSSTNRIEQNKQLKKAPEYRKTTYFGCDVSLDVTNKVNDMNESKYITPVTETMEFTNRHNSNRNEQIKVTKMNHKDIECVIPETQDMNVSIKSSNLNNKIDLPKNRHTNYFNQTAEIDITHDRRENQNLFNATKANPIQIGESFNAERITGESEKLKNVPESRKTTYFGFEESLDLTNMREDTCVPLQKTTAAKFMLRGNEKIAKYTENNDGHKKIYLINKALDDNDKPIGNRYTRLFNNSDVMNITLDTNKNSNPLQSIIQDHVEKISKKRCTELFNNTNAIITAIEEHGPMKEQENDGNMLKLNKHSCRKTLHFDTDNQMDVTEHENNEEKKEQCLTSRAYGQSISIKSQNKEEYRKENDNLSNKENIQENLPKFSINDRSVLLSSMIDEMEIDTTPTCQLKTVRPSCFNDYNTYTPGRSILEFLRIEKELEQEGENYPNEHSILSGSSKTESAKESRNQKRPTSNLTPNFPNSKKRQSLSCDNSLLKYPRSTTINDNLMKVHDVEKEKSTLQPIGFKEKFFSCSFSQNKNIVEPERRIESKHTPSLLSKDIEISSKLSNEPITPRPRSEMRKSRIPTYTGSAKKNDISSNTLTTSKSINIPDSFLLHSQEVEEARFARNNEEFHAQENYISKPELSEKNITNEYNLQQEKYSIRKSIFDFGDQPITISDVSEHYLSLKQKRNSSLYKNKSKIINKNNKLTESLFEIIDCDDIDKTKLDLVETLLDESEEDEDEKEDEKEEEIEEKEQSKQEEYETPENVNQLLKSQPSSNERRKHGNSSKNSLFHLTLPEMENRNKRNSFCRKCKCCKDILLNETVSSGVNESFVMPEMPSLDHLMDQFDKRMEKITRGPTLEVVDEFWERMMLQRAAEISDESSDEDEEYGEDPWITAFKERSTQIEKNVQARLLKPMNARKPFIDRLKDLLKNSPNWIMNAEMMLSQIIRFRHKETYTICISLQYEKRDPFGNDVTITSILLEDSSVPKRIWVPFDFIIHFQLQLEIPHNLRSYCAGNSEIDIYEMLIKLDEICRNTVQMSKELWKMVVEKKGILIRENGQTLIQRFMRKIVLNSAGLYQSTQSQEIRIGVKDIKNLCFKDITMPPVYMFREEIQNIPAGLDFLRILLNDSTLFLKNLDNQ